VVLGRNVTEKKRRQTTKRSNGGRRKGKGDDGPTPFDKEGLGGLGRNNGGEAEKKGVKSHAKKWELQRCWVGGKMEKKKKCKTGTVRSNETPLKNTGKKNSNCKETTRGGAGKPRRTRKGGFG